jgi:cell division protein FtsI/penicillin-binding protein 2
MRGSPALSCALVLALACDARSSTATAPAEQPADPVETATPSSASEPVTANTWPERAEAALARAERAGAVIVLDAQTGELLATAERPGVSSRPAFDARSPGSVVKPLLALAALHEGVLQADETISCTGPRVLEGHELTCFAEHGEIALAEALATSCNHYAFEIAHRLGLERIHHHFTIFGLGDAGGFIPDPSTKGASAAVIGSGHGALKVSPVQLARAYHSLATGRGELPYDEARLDTIRAAMRGVVESEVGTGRRAAVPGLEILAKTGTSEMGEGDEALGLAWFAGWAPADDPKIVVVVQLEGEGTGGTVAAPVARELFEAI